MSSTFVRIGRFILDVSLSEEHKFESEVTEFPVESGGSISDNIRPKPIQVTITGVITDTPLDSNATNKPIVLPDSLSETGLGAAIDLISPVGGAIKYLRSEQAYQYLKSIYDKGETVDIRTSLATFNNMALESLSVPRSKETTGGITFTADFKQIKQVVNRRLRTAIRNGTGKKKRGLKPTDLGVSDPIVLWRQANPPGGSNIYEKVFVKYIQSNNPAVLSADLALKGSVGGWFFWTGGRGLQGGRHAEDITRAIPFTYPVQYSVARGARLSPSELSAFYKDMERDQEDRRRLGNALVDQGATRSQVPRAGVLLEEPYFPKNNRSDFGNLTRQEVRHQSNRAGSPEYSNKGNFEDSNPKPKTPDFGKFNKAVFGD